jgi:hypothetical protein
MGSAALSWVDEAPAGALGQVTPKGKRVGGVFFFEKKAAKNSCEPELAPSGKTEAKTIKSFLLLFFKKEVLLS